MGAVELCAKAVAVRPRLAANLASTPKPSSLSVNLKAQQTVEHQSCHFYVKEQKNDRRTIAAIIALESTRKRQNLEKSNGECWCIKSRMK